MAKVMFVVPHLNNSMRLLADYLRYLDRRFQVTLVALENQLRFASEFPPEARVVVIGKRGKLATPARTFWKIYQEARNHDLVVGWAELTPTYYSSAAAMLAGKPCVGFVHTNLTTVFNLKLRPARLHRPFINFFYRRLKASIGVSEGSTADLRDNFHLQNAMAIVNGIDIERIRGLAEKPIPERFTEVFRKPVVINVAVMMPQKHQEVLLESHARLIRQGIDHHLLMLGDGPLKQQMADLVKQLGIESSVFFGGYVDNPYPMMKAATVFALCSRFEGHPLVLAEALALGLPVVSTNCPSGPSEILDNGKYGRLVPVGDVDQFTAALLDLLSSAPARQALISLADEGAERNRIQNRAREMEALFNRVLAGQDALAPTTSPAISKASADAA